MEIKVGKMDQLSGSSLRVGDLKVGILVNAKEEIKYLEDAKENIEKAIDSLRKVSK